MAGTTNLTDARIEWIREVFKRKSGRTITHATARKLVEELDTIDQRFAAAEHGDRVLETLKSAKRLGAELTTLLEKF